MRKRMVSALLAGLICFGSTAVPASAMGQEPEPAAEPEPEPEKKSSSAPLLAVVGLLALAGGGAFYWFKLRRKPEPKADPDAEDDFEEDSSKN